MVGWFHVLLIFLSSILCELFALIDFIQGTNSKRSYPVQTFIERLPATELTLVGGYISMWRYTMKKIMQMSWKYFFGKADIDKLTVI